MTNFTIIGTGKMGDAIGALFAAGGNDVTHIAHAQVGSDPVIGDVVILAVPYPATDEAVAAYGDQLAGKTVVDISNPLNFETLDSLVVPDGSSAAAQIQAKLQDSKVLKAFNTNLVATLVSKQVGGLPATVLIAGDDDDAKRTLADAVTAEQPDQFIATMIQIAEEAQRDPEKLKHAPYTTPVRRLDEVKAAREPNLRR